MAPTQHIQPRQPNPGPTPSCTHHLAVRQILNLMHACAASGTSSLPEAAAAAGDGGVRGAVAAAGALNRGNAEWGAADGRVGLVQAYNHVIRVCGDAGGTELALELLEEMHRR